LGVNVVDVANINSLQSVAITNRDNGKSNTDASIGREDIVGDSE